MFSLIITIISVALVAALALATLYYGGAAFNQGRADAEASKIINQGQQVLAAADLYYANHGTWPTVAKMVEDGYLKSAPQAQAPAVGNAMAASAPWVQVTADVPVYLLTGVETDTCRSVNKHAYSLDGILPDVLTVYSTQCYGSGAGALKTVVSKGANHLAAVAAANDPDLPAVDISSGALPAAGDTGAWTVPPGAEAVAEAPASGATTNFTLTPVYDTTGQIQYEDGGTMYPWFDSAEEAARAAGALTLTRAGDVYTSQPVYTLEYENYYFTSDLVRVTNAGTTAAPVSFVEGQRFDGADRYAPATLDGVAFCASGASLPPGESCLLSAKRALNCGDAYQVSLGNLTFRGLTLTVPPALDDPENPFTPCTDPVVVDPPVAPPDVIQPGSCPFTFVKYPNILVNETSNTYTITAWTGYHTDGTHAGRVQNFGYGWSGLGNFDTLPGFALDMTNAQYENIWQTVTGPTNMTIGPNQGVGAYGYNGAVVMGAAKAAVYVQELDTWCAFGAHSVSDPQGATNAQGFYIGIPGSAWNPPAAMDGAWSETPAGTEGVSGSAGNG